MCNFIPTFIIDGAYAVARSVADLCELVIIERDKKIINSKKRPKHERYETIVSMSKMPHLLRMSRVISKTYFKSFKRFS